MSAETSTPRRRGRPPKITQIELQRRNRKILERVEAGAIYRDIADEFKLSIAQVGRIVDELIAAEAPVEHIETVRRLLIARSNQMLQVWLPHALGHTEVVVLAREGDTQVPITVPISVPDMAKAAKVVLEVTDRIARYTGVEAEVARRAAVIAGTEQGSEAELLDRELAELIEGVRSTIQDRADGK